MGSGVSSEFGKFLIGKKNKQNTEKSHHVTLKSPWKCHPGPNFGNSQITWPPWPWPDFYPPNVGLLVPLYQLSKKGSRFHSPHPPKKVTNSQNCQVVLTFCLKEKVVGNHQTSIHPTFKKTSSKEFQRSLSLSLPKGNWFFLITLSVEILNSIKKKSQRLPGHCRLFWGASQAPYKQNPEQSVIFTVDFFWAKNGCRFSARQFEDVSNTWGGSTARLSSSEFHRGFCLEGVNWIDAGLLLLSKEFARTRFFQVTFFVRCFKGSFQGFPVTSIWVIKTSRMEEKGSLIGECQFNRIPPTLNTQWDLCLISFIQYQ